MTLKKHYDLVIIGAGPAGQAAAIAAAKHQVTVAVFDEQPGLGGQIYRNIESTPKERAVLLGKDYMHGKVLADAFRNANIEYYPNSQIWTLDGRYEIGVLHNQKNQIIQADTVILATGAMERPLPFPGWTLPGVMYAGAGQILLKSAGVAPVGPVVLVGSGPLLLLLATQYIKAGVEIKAVLDTTPWQNYLLALLNLPRALLNYAYLIKGFNFQWQLKKNHIPVFFGVKNFQAEGGEALESIAFAHKGQNKSLKADLLLTHFGVIPNVWLSQTAGCEHVWDARQFCWRPKLDIWGNSSKKGLLIAGDGAGIDGAKAAEASGKLASLEALLQLGAINQAQRDESASLHFQNKRKERHIRPFLERLFKIPDYLIKQVPDSTLLCRCEEISAQQIKTAITEEHSDSNAIKFLLRCGMGPCQGRQCALPVTTFSAACSRKKVPEIGHYRGRPPVSPLTLEQLAALENNNEL